MRANPRIISPNRHEHEIEGTIRILQSRKRARVGGIARKTDGVAAALDQVSIVAAMLVLDHARAPMRHFQAGELDGTGRRLDFHRFAPIQLVDILKALAVQ